jgi:16S rRNA processing protein RimM
MSAWARVAQIVKTRNLEGSVVAQSADGLPFLLSEGMDVYFVPPTLRGPRTARVAALQKLKEGSYAVDFEGVGTIDDAEKLVGCYCLASRASLPQQDDEGVPVGLIGYRVVDEVEGDLGRVSEIIASAAQSVLVVEGPHGQVMIPAVDAFILQTDDDARCIATRIPRGLLDLSRSGTEASDSDAGEDA